MKGPARGLSPRNRGDIMEVRKRRERAVQPIVAGDGRRKRLIPVTKSGMPLEEEKMELYENLARLRKEAGLSQQDLAERLDVSRQSISKWELGTALPSMENLIGLSRLYGVSLDYLVGNSETRERADTNSADTEEAPAEETPADGPPPDDSNSRGRGRRIVLERILLVVLSIAVVVLAAALAYTATKVGEPEEVYYLEMERGVIDLEDADRFTVHPAP